MIDLLHHAMENDTNPDFLRKDLFQIMDVEDIDMVALAYLT
jgi:hypothetical protein